MGENSVTCKFAEITVKINYLHSRFADFCKNYVCSGNADLEITVTEQDIAEERIRSQAEGNFPDEYLETLAVYRKFCTAAADYGVILFHGSAVAVDGEAFIFTAPSGTGKSTHARLWRKALGDRVEMVNDDKPLIRFKDGEIYVYGTPWNGKHGLSANISRRLKAVCYLNRGAENSISPLSPREGFPLLLSQTFLPEAEEVCGKVITMVGGLSQSVSLYSLFCNVSQEAALLSYNTMKEGKKV